MQIGGNFVVKFTPPGSTETVMLTRRLSIKEVKALESNPGILDDPQNAFRLLAASVAAMSTDPPAVSN